MLRLVAHLVISSVHRDGFALNAGAEDWVLDRVSDCFDAAEQIQTDFKLFISFDMSYVTIAILQSGSPKLYIIQTGHLSHLPWRISLT